MRPLLVLSLVLVAVAVLLYALSSVDGNSEPAAPVGITAAEPDAATNEPAAEPVTINSPTSTPISSGSDRQVAPSGGSGRQAVGAPAEVFENALYGTVTDPDGLPLENAVITLTEGGIQAGMLDIQRVMGTLSDENQKSRTTRTNAEGAYRFGNLEPGNYSMMTKHVDFSDHQDPMIPIQFVGETFWDVSLQEGLMVNGYVHDYEGNPIPDAELTLSSSMTPALFAAPGTRKQEGLISTKTDETGYYRFLNIVPGNSWHLSAGAEKFGTQTKRNLRIIPKNGTHNFDFRLDLGELLSGVVLGPDRAPIVGASVRVIGYQEPQSISSFTQTDQAGKFLVKGLVKGSYALIVDAEGWGSARLNRIEAPTEGIEVEMAEQGSVMGRVVDMNGDAVPAFTISVHQYIAQTSTYGRQMQQQKIKEPKGTFNLIGISAGRYGLKVSASGFASTYSEDFDVAQGLPTTDIVVRMSAGGRIVGIILDATSGQPLAGATVMTQDNNFQDNPLMRVFRTSMPRRTTEQQARTDKDGRFELSMLSAELYQVQVKHPSYPTESVNNLRVVDGQATDMGSVRLQPGSAVRGTVFDSAGVPLPGATVQLVSTIQGQMMHIEGRTSSEGRYILRNVPAGDYQLSASGPAENDNIFGPIVDMQNSQVNFKVARGREYTQDLNLGG